MTGNVSFGRLIINDLQTRKTLEKYMTMNGEKACTAIAGSLHTLDEASGNIDLYLKAISKLDYSKCDKKKDSKILFPIYRDIPLDEFVLDLVSKSYDVKALANCCSDNSCNLNLHDSPSKILDKYV